MAEHSSTHTTQRRYPPELRERAVRIVPETASEQGERFGVVTRVARQLGISMRTGSGDQSGGPFRAQIRPPICRSGHLAAESGLVRCSLCWRQTTQRTMRGPCHEQVPLRYAVSFVLLLAARQRLQI